MNNQDKVIGKHLVKHPNSCGRSGRENSQEVIRCVFVTNVFNNDKDDFDYICSLTLNYGNSGINCDGLSNKKKCPFWRNK